MLANLMLGESRYRGSGHQVAVSVLPAHRFCGHHRQQSISHKEVLASPCIAESHVTWVVAGSCPTCRSGKGLLTVAICRRAFQCTLVKPTDINHPSRGCCLLAQARPCHARQWHHGLARVRVLRTRHLAARGVRVRCRRQWAAVSACLAKWHAWRECSGYLQNRPKDVFSPDAVVSDCSRVREPTIAAKVPCSDIRPAA